MTRSGGPDPRPGLTRRAVLYAAGATGGVAAMGASAKADLLTETERKMVLQLAKAGSAYPMEPPSFGEKGTAMSRATMPRLREAEARLTAERAALVRKGAQALIAQGLLGAGRAQLLAGVGKAANGQGKDALIAAVQLAVATVSKHFDPAKDHPANDWVAVLGRLAERGIQPRPLRHQKERD
ncbi:hypothetical protein [Actinomadura livida]|uniref:Uncharacterized protein n=1 Tax=Actinomadura livida TaxID=79909 RepID=A0A7W7ICX7_9ACTN|nr:MULTISPECIES: hypothetical protein [Actinomadura]MBB4774791.1 hypothetical protein [Actinomadura catellatispora]GGU05976.1 hypothetical protein GCM10010208_32820 [Actinomadura livida]